MKYPILILGIVVAVLLPVIDMSMNFSSKWDTDTKFQIAISLGILFTSLLASYIAYVVEKLKKKTKEDAIKLQMLQSTVSSLSEAMGNSAAVCLAINKAELYSKLNDLVLSANQKLELMYLGDKPPDKLEKFAIRDTYIRDLEKKIIQEEITIKRVILYNSANKQWIRQMANKFKGKRYFSLYIVEQDKMPSLSIQVIDDSKVIVINVLEKPNVDKKHIYIDSVNLNMIYKGLYNDIIAKCICIIENGSLDAGNFEKYLR